MNIIFDYNRTIFDPETQSLYPNVIALLQELAGEHTLFLISKKEPTRIETIKTLGIQNFFKEVLLVEKKTPELFLNLAIDPQQTLVVGDCLHSEIKAGNDFGATTVRIKQGIFKDAFPANTREIPTHEIAHLNELLPLLQKYV